MTLIAASIITKSGKALVTRSFVAQMTKARLEGLLDAFPKLIVDLEKAPCQHTFVETDSARYVYQPLSNIYMVLITTKASNILEDLETLRLFSRVVPEYCRSHSELEILNKAFELIFAFDEIVAIGYRENVSLAQVRTLTEMDSHEERVANQIKKSKEREAKRIMLDKAKELKKKREEALKRGIKPQVDHMNAISSSNTSRSNMKPDFDNLGRDEIINKPVLKPTSGGGKALKLGSRDTSDDQFLKQLQSEGQAISSDMQTRFRLPDAKQANVEDHEWPLA